MEGDFNFKIESLFLLARISDPDRIVDINILLANCQLLQIDFEVLITRIHVLFPAQCFDDLCTAQLLYNLTLFSE